nr:regulator of chromosome condensation isoform X3 [Chrysemys picta bellii]
MLFACSISAALQAVHACPQALQAAHACPQASDAMLHQLKRAAVVCEDMEDTSPFKLRSKKKRLSTNFEKCVVCQGNQKNAKLSQATSAGQNSVMLAAEARRDELYWRLLGEFSSLVAVPPILYHRGCFQKYTSKSNLAHVRVMSNPGRKTDSDSDQRASCSPESIATGLSTSSSNGSCCIVCLRKTRKKDKKLHRIETFERAANLREAALQRGDADMLRRASVEDLIAKEAVYHATCISSYLSKTNLKAKQSTIQSPYDIAFYRLIGEIDNDLMDNKKALLLSKLLQRYKALLPSEIETASYSSSKLQARLVKHYGSAISFHTARTRQVYHCSMQRDNIS